MAAITKLPLTSVVTVGTSVCTKTGQGNKGSNHNAPLGHKGASPSIRPVSGVVIDDIVAAADGLTVEAARRWGWLSKLALEVDSRYE
jgi:hypothetical protein